ncbi:MAG: hypothetical protein IKF72_11275 [Kiritimatiellae bacterium]|nr:hypothetical protein [Kiritimatiellia bacterium]
MSIQVNGNPVDAAKMWETILSSVGEVQKTTTADGKEALTVTIGGGESVRTVTMVPDDLELPATADSASLDSLVKKLAGLGLEMTEEEIVAFKEAATQVYAAATKALAEVKAKSRGNTMFDLYALMKLMVEVAQKQRDAQREMRSTENLLVQKAIQNQADQQRDAAWLGLVVGVTCGLISAGFSLGMMIGQSSAASKQSSLANNAGLDAATTKVDMLKMADSPVHANQQLATIQNKVGGETSNNVLHEFNAKVNGGEAGNLKAKFTDAETKLENAKLTLEAKKIHLEAVKAVHAEKVGAQNTAQQAYDAKAAEVGLEGKQAAFDQAVGAKQQYIRDEMNAGRAPAQDELTRLDNNTAQAKAALDEAKQTLQPYETRLSNAKLEVADAQGNVANAQNDVTLAESAIDTAKADLAKAKSDYVETLKSVGDEYAEKYQVALDRQKNPPEGADKATLDADVKKARNEMLMARALEAKALSEPGVLSPAEHKQLVSGAKMENDIALRRLNESEDYKQAGMRIQRLMGFNGIIMAIGGTLQSMTQNLSALQQAEATRQGAEQQRENEMLDQTKDLFAQDQKVIDAVIQLMQAVLQAETTSIRDAIQA